MTDRSVIVTGASGQIGYFLLVRLASADNRVTAVARVRPRWARDRSVNWRLVDLQAGWPRDLQGDTLIHAAPLDLLSNLMHEAAQCGVRRLVAFSSTSATVKADSNDPKERLQAGRLRESEKNVVEQCRRAGIDWTIFRPTLIYGAGLDTNISALAAFIRSFGFVPLSGAAQGLRQPVHADDLASACLAALGCPAAYRRSYALGGETRLPYRQMIEQVFHALGSRPRIIRIPAAFARAGLKGLAWLPRYRQLSPALIDRLERDQLVDFSPASADFGFAPRPFQPDRADLSPPQ